MRFAALFAAALLLLLSRTSRAWVETQIQSSTVQVDVDRAGVGTVSHELVMQVRGGPLLSLELAGVDGDAEPLGEGSVVNTLVPGAAPLPLLLERREDGTLRLEIDGKGIRRGTWLFRFRYRTHLLERGALRREGDSVELAWTGPRYEHGIDSAKVLFRVPASPVAPSAVKVDRDQIALGGEDPGGVFLTQVRRTTETDEVELVRPRVARGEPVVWRARFSAAAFDAFAPAVAPSPTIDSADSPAPRPVQEHWLLVAAVISAILYTGLVFVKHRSSARAAAERAAVVRPLLPLPWSANAPLAGLLVGVAVWLAGVAERPTLAGVALTAALAMATVVTPLAAPAPRGPGRWLPLTDAEAFAAPPRRRPGAWLDAGTGRGFACFALLLAGFVVTSAVWFQRSPYHALLLALGSASLLPIFLTGRGAELPADPALEPRPLLAWLARELRTAGIRAVPWARLPRGAREPDELRLLLAPDPGREGLVGVEVAVEHLQGQGGVLGLPCVIVRAREGSDAHACLRSVVSWTRGRTPEERVAVVRPRLPTREHTLALCRRLINLLRRPDARASARQTRRPSPGLELRFAAGGQT